MKENSNNYQNDVKSIDTIIHALYDVISGEKGKPRDWKREKFLFHPTGRLIVINKNKDNQVKANLMTPDEFINYAEPFLVFGIFVVSLCFFLYKWATSSSK